MAIYDVDYAQVAPNLEPPQKRLPNYIQWLVDLLYPLQQDHDDFFTGYANGDPAPLWDPHADYGPGDTVTFGVYYGTADAAVNKQITSEQGQPVYRARVPIPSYWGQGQVDYTCSTSTPVGTPPSPGDVFSVNGGSFTGTVTSYDPATGTIVLVLGNSGWFITVPEILTDATNGFTCLLTGIYPVTGIPSPNDGSGAQAICTVSGGSVTSVIVTAGGDSYNNINTAVLFVGGGGTGAQAVPVTAGGFGAWSIANGPGAISYTFMQANGVDYVVPPAAFVLPSPLSAAPIVYEGGRSVLSPVILDGGVTSVTVTDQGEYYGDALLPIIFQNQPGPVVSVDLLSGGSGYTEPPQVFIVPAWDLVQQDFRGATQRVRYGGWVDTLTYALNEWFHTTYREPGVYGWWAGVSTLGSTGSGQVFGTAVDSLVWTATFGTLVGAPLVGDTIQVVSLQVIGTVLSWDGTTLTFSSDRDIAAATELLGSSGWHGTVSGPATGGELSGITPPGPYQSDVFDTGLGFTVPPAIGFASSGAGATAHAVLDYHGSVISVIVDSGGSGYSYGDQVYYVPQTDFGTQLFVLALDVITGFPDAVPGDSVSFAPSGAFGTVYSLGGGQLAVQITSAAAPTAADTVTDATTGTWSATITTVGGGQPNRTHFSDIFIVLWDKEQQPFYIGYTEPYSEAVTHDEQAIVATGRGGYIGYTEDSLVGNTDFTIAVPKQLYNTVGADPAIRQIANTYVPAGLLYEMYRYQP